jgi:hypothetical protein
VGGLTGLGYLLAMGSQLWLFCLIINECEPQAILLALLIPFFLWFFALQRWDVAKWPFVFNVAGILLMLVGFGSNI